MIWYLIMQDYARHHHYNHDEGNSCLFIEYTNRRVVHNIRDLKKIRVAVKFSMLSTKLFFCINHALQMREHSYVQS